MRHMAISAISALLLLVGCAHEKPVEPRPAATPAAPQKAGGEQKPQTATAPAPAAPAAGTALETGHGSGAEAVASSSHGGGAGSGNAKARVPGRGEATAVPRTAAPGTATAGTAAGGGTAAHPAPSPAPALDLTSLEQRLRETRAIGVFTKLSLKNQVDDLLGEFRAFHRRQRAVTVAELRQKYDLLLLKVLSLLQDGDAPLAAAISSSREAIWAMLIDPQKFDKLARL
jgi:hypothetical protein